MTNQPSPIIRLATANEIIPLRASILRPGQPLSDSHYSHDNSPDTLHAGAFSAVNCIGAATFLREPFDAHDAYRLRGMAVHPAHQRAGIGRSLLQFLLLQASAVGIRHFWCNARFPAVPFYTRLGWQTLGEPFDIPTAGGLHYRMRLILNSP